MSSKVIVKLYRTPSLSATMKLSPRKYLSFSDSSCSCSSCSGTAMVCMLIMAVPDMKVVKLRSYEGTTYSLVQTLLL